jgi:hypothetical protein
MTRSRDNDALRGWAATAWRYVLALFVPTAALEISFCSMAPEFFVTRHRQLPKLKPRTLILSYLRIALQRVGVWDEGGGKNVWGERRENGVHVNLGQEEEEEGGGGGR